MEAREFIGKICEQGEVCFSGGTHCVAIVPKDSIGPIENKAKNPPNILGVIDKFDYAEVPKIISVETLKKYCSQANTLKLETYKLVASETCDECQGSGTVEFRYTDKSNTYHTTDDDCPICEGNGAISGYRVIETNEFVENPIVGLKIGSAMFNYEHISDILQACKLLEASEIKEVKNGSEANAYVYEFDKIKILIMPMIEYDKDNFQFVNCEEI